MAKNKIGDRPKSLVGIKSKSNIMQAIAHLQAAQSCMDACASERAARHLHVGTISQLNRQLGEIMKKLFGYANG